MGASPLQPLLTEAGSSASDGDVGSALALENRHTTEAYLHTISKGVTRDEARFSSLCKMLGLFRLVDGGGDGR